MHEVLKQDERDRWYYQLPEDLKYKLKVHHEPVPCFVTISIDMTDTDSFRNKLQKETGVHVSSTSLIIKAAANAAVDFPILCGIWEGADRIICPAPGEVDINGPIHKPLRDLCHFRKASSQGWSNSNPKADERYP